MGHTVVLKLHHASLFPATYLTSEQVRSPHLLFQSPFPSLSSASYSCPSLGFHSTLCRSIVQYLIFQASIFPECSHIPVDKSPCQVYKLSARISLSNCFLMRQLTSSSATQPGLNFLPCQKNFSTIPSACWGETKSFRLCSSTFILFLSDTLILRPDFCSSDARSFNLLCISPWNNKCLSSNLYVGLHWNSLVIGRALLRMRSSSTMRNKGRWQDTSLFYHSVSYIFDRNFQISVRSWCGLFRINLTIWIAASELSWLNHRGL